MKADYQLRHELYGRQGSLWERQVDKPTRSRIRKIVAEAGNASLLAELDTIAAAALNRTEMLVEDAHFRFVDGNFAVVGQHQRDYSHRLAEMPDGSRLHVAYREGAAFISGEGVPTSIARITSDFARQVEADAGLLSSTRDWYLVPTPADLIPLVIETRNPDEYLVQGIDFLAFNGYIAMTDAPTGILPIGVVKVSSGYRRTSSPNAFVMSAPSRRRGSKWLSDYTYRTQSVEAFRRAAAEYAGMYVFQTADVVLGVAVGVGSRRIYSMAMAGAVDIDYPHTPLVKYQQVPPGTVICLRFEVVGSKPAASVDPKRALAMDWSEPLVLDGILPVNGLTWDGRSRLNVEALLTAPVSLKPHVRLMFDGPTETLERFWEFSRLHERATGRFLYDELGEPSLPATVDFWDLLQTFYGPQLLLAVSEDHGPSINSRLWRFLMEHHPQSCGILISIKLPFAVERRGAYGEPLVTERGDEYLTTPPPEPPPDCEVFLLVHNGVVLRYDTDPLSYTVCPELPEEESPLPPGLTDPDGLLLLTSPDGSTYLSPPL